MPAPTTLLLMAVVAAVAVAAQMLSPTLLSVTGAVVVALILGPILLSVTGAVAVTVLPTSWQQCLPVKEAMAVAVEMPLPALPIPPSSQKPAAVAAEMPLPI